MENNDQPFLATHTLGSDPRPKRAMLVSVYKGTDQKQICQEHLQELSLLAKTLGVDVVEKIPCLVRRFDAAKFITEGKLEELMERARELEIELLIFDDEITPGQQRNLEAIFKLPVADRTAVILAVFAQRAQTKEARLQIELAQVKYQAPRLKKMWSHLSRQAGTGAGGAGGFTKGEGEKQIEIDRRILKKQIDLLNKEIREVRANRDTLRIAREKSGIPIFAIIGYTNAGKSTLLNALTDAHVFVEDKLFATLDTTTRKYTLRNNQELLLIDTVGFIRKLPHLLVAAFKSTLEEALYADILLHVIDASHPMAMEQAETTFEVLKELGAEKKPFITVLNKADLCQNRAIMDRMRITYGKVVEISALNRTGFDELQEMMLREIENRRKNVTLRIPQSEYNLVSEVIRSGQVMNQEYDENDILMKVSISEALAGKLNKYIVAS